MLIEETAAIEIARELAERNGVADRITFLHGSSFDVELRTALNSWCPSLLASDALNERLYPILADANARFITPGAVLIPRQLRVMACGCFSSQIADEKAYMVRQQRAVEELPEILGLDLEPVVRRNAARISRDSGRLNYQAGWAWPDDAAFPERLTEVVPILDLDLRKLTDPLRDLSVGFTAERSGTLNAICSYFVAELTDGVCLSTEPTRRRDATTGSVHEGLRTSSNRAGDTMV